MAGNAQFYQWIQLKRFLSDHSINGRIHIQHSQNCSDRFAILSKRVLHMLTSYWFAYNKSNGWLFPQKRNSVKHYNPDAFSNRFIQ